MWIVDSLPYLSPQQQGQSDAWTQETAQAGRTGTQRLREVGSSTPPDHIATALGLEPSATAIVRRRIMLLDDEPVELTDSWYPEQIASGTALAAPAKIKGGAVTLLAELGYRIHESREEIEFRGASADEAEALEVPPGTPVIVLHRTCLTSDNVPFEASAMVMIAKGRLLRYRMIAG